MATTASDATTTSAPFAERFAAFYRGPFLQEHQHPANVALHVTGTVSALALLAACAAGLVPAKAALLFPVVHALPGVVGHAAFEPSESAGTLRVFRQDLPRMWFFYANHVMSAEALLRVKILSP